MRPPPSSTPPVTCSRRAPSSGSPPATCSSRPAARRGLAGPAHRCWPGGCRWAPASIEQLAWIDFELKRNGIVEPIPLGIDLPTRPCSPPTSAPADGRRRRSSGPGPVRDAVQRLRGHGRELPERPGRRSRSSPHGHGYLLARTHRGRAGPQPGRASSWAGISRPRMTPPQVLADCSAHRVGAGARTRTTRWWSGCARWSEHFGVSVLPGGLRARGPAGRAADVLLVPGVRVCFTGEVVSAEHGCLGTGPTMERLGRAARTAWPSPNVTKTKTDVLVVAELGTQSRQDEERREVGQARDRGRGVPGLGRAALTGLSGRAAGTGQASAWAPLPSREPAAGSRPGLVPATISLGGPHLSDAAGTHPALGAEPAHLRDVHPGPFPSGGGGACSAGGRSPRHRVAAPQRSSRNRGRRRPVRPR